MLHKVEIRKRRISSGAIGGAIAPGMQIAHDALVRMAARLHKVEIVPPRAPCHRQQHGSRHAIGICIFWGYVRSSSEGMVRRLGAEQLVVCTEASGLMNR